MKQTLNLAVLAGANLIVSLLFQWYVITQLGVGVETDAFFAAMALPQVILFVVSSSLTHVLVPLLATDNKTTFQQNAWSFFLGVTGLFTALAVLLYVTSAYWVPLLVPGFSQQGRLLTVTLTRLQLVSMIFTASASVLWAVYHAKQRFIWVELSGLLSSLIGLALVWKLLPRYGVVAAALVIVVRTALQVLVLLPGLGHWQRPDWRSDAMRQAWARIRPLLIGTSYYRTDALIDRFLASMAAAGGLSLLYIGQQIYGVANVVADKAIAAPLVPQLAIEANSDRWSNFKQLYRRRLLLVGGLTALGFVIHLLVGERILNLLIGHGGVTRDNVHLLWLIMVALVGFFTAGAMGQITAITFYAMGDTKTPTRLSIVTYTIYIPIKILGFVYYGLMGLAVVTSIYLFVNLLIQVLLLEVIVIPRREKRTAESFSYAARD